MRIRRPIVLTVAQGLWSVSTVPFLILAMLTTIGPPERQHRVTAQLPRLAGAVLSHRVSGIALWLAAISFLLAAVLVGPGRRWARTAAVALTGLYDVILVMLLLADDPRLSRLAAGAVVVLGSLAGVVLSYQPTVERYLAG